MEDHPIRFFEESVEAFLFIPDFKRLRRVIRAVMDDFHRQLKSLNVVFLDDEQLRQINQDFLQHDYYTDIITFNLSEEAKVIEGELYISLSRVVANAQHYNTQVKDELGRVVIHGVLHLGGLTDKADDQVEEMRRLESHYLNHLNAN